MLTRQVPRSSVPITPVSAKCRSNSVAKYGFPPVWSSKYVATDGPASPSAWPAARSSSAMRSARSSPPTTIPV